ncbi:MAG: hypothetical protein A2534_02645 [Candidatus Magasanikbacteria bacterium RIFOXYD2_FULL_39_9]|uniref:Uncharacterized protein n=1 Tax=Candidatus Magasanikbacteria bacterium RIFOXYD1_FULL_40_23 TaxID=1798705 RepID=A0A1F6PAZ7_9BACT|nr:MAG: hypothetical protein A2534_02645 [Candidatus Magasanikbacteria bacterium RIFOXYD2_FULL_39_9]OGH93347.1 MAG: hypothetical protein A2563_01930 [Candidatus Magasanikbacteria bacterium RIFOXYD1_FULL_40_23]
MIACLNKCRVDTGRESQAKVIGDAIYVYNLLVEAAKNGDRIFIGKFMDVKNREVVMKALNEAREKARKANLHLVP